MSFRALAKHLSVAIGLLLALGVSSSQDQESLRESNKTWQSLAELEFPRNQPVAFEELRKTRLQRAEKIQHGHLWVTEAGELAMQIDSPRPELRKIQGTRLTLTRGDKVRSTKLNPERGAHQLLMAIVNVLRGDIASLQNNFQLTNPTPEARQQTPQTEWCWTLKPKHPALNKQMSALILRGKGQALLSLRAERGTSYQEVRILEPAKAAHEQE